MAVERIACSLFSGWHPPVYQCPHAVSPAPPPITDLYRSYECPFGQPLYYNSSGCFILISFVALVVMEEQAGSPGGNTDSNSQRNGEEVRDKISYTITHCTIKYVLLVYVVGNCHLKLQNIFILAETTTWQLDQGEKEEEADEGQQRTQGSPDRLRSLHERQTGATTGRASRRALPWDNKDAGQRVEQAAPWGKTGRWTCCRQYYTRWQLWTKNVAILLLPRFMIQCAGLLVAWAASSKHC